MRKPYAKYMTHRLVARLLLYVPYIGCGCDGDESNHDPKSKGCARADVANLVREISRRLAGTQVTRREK